MQRLRAKSVLSVCVCVWGGTTEKSCACMHRCVCVCMSESLISFRIVESLLFVFFFFCCDQMPCFKLLAQNCKQAPK